MTTVTLVTSFPVSAWDLYARRFFDTACKHLPPNVEICAYYNAIAPQYDSPRVTFIDNYSIENGVCDFLRKHGNDQYKWGKVPGRKDNFRHNVCAFSHKAYALEHASKHAISDLLLWCDSDVEFFADVPPTIFDDMLPQKDFACFLERGESYHMETGWYILRVAHPQFREFVDRFMRYYRRDLFLREREWHDAYLMTQVVREMKYKGLITVFNLNESRRPGAGHPWMESTLARFSDHKKGRRKLTGSSWAEDLKINRTEPYWQNLPNRN